MEKFGVSVDSAKVEDKAAALNQWWERHCKSFSQWYLVEINEEKRKELLMKACPDIPEKSPIMREADNQKISATDVILPEFSLDSLLSSNGRLTILFMTNRLTSKDLSMSKDVTFLNNLFEKKQLPLFGYESLKSLNTPFIDPLDTSETIQSIKDDASEETKNQIIEFLKTGRLINAYVWLALKIRRESIVSLFENLAIEHQKQSKIKPSPTYISLLAGELAQQLI